MAVNQAATLLFLYAETPLHPGTGASLGVVDLPIQRERTTNYPIIQSSSVKGVLRASTPKTDPAINMLFGAENQDYAGALSFADARLLLFPVRSLAGVFAWITCPAILARLQRDLSLANLAQPNWQLPSDDELKQGKVWLPQSADTVVQVGGQVALEEFLFTPEKKDLASSIADWLSANALPDTAEFDWWRNKLKKSLVIMHDDDFRDFVTTATEIVARTKLDSDTKKVAQGALWYQEFLPSETIFYSTVLAQDSRSQPKQAASQVLAAFEGLKIGRIQIGGDETTGKGFCKLRYLKNL